MSTVKSLLNRDWVGQLWSQFIRDFTVDSLFLKLFLLLECVSCCELSGLFWSVLDESERWATRTWTRVPTCSCRSREGLEAADSDRVRVQEQLHRARRQPRLPDTSPKQCRRSTCSERWSRSRSSSFFWTSQLQHRFQLQSVHLRSERPIHLPRSWKVLGREELLPNGDLFFTLVYQIPSKENLSHVKKRMLLLRNC